MATALTSGHFNNLRSLSLQPLLASSAESDTQNESDPDTELDKSKILKAINKIILGSKSMEHISLGFLATNRNDPDKMSIVSSLAEKHSLNIKSLNLSTCWSSSRRSTSVGAFIRPTTNTQTSAETCQASLDSELGHLLSSFGHLRLLSIDYADLNDELIDSALFATCLRR